MNASDMKTLALVTACAVIVIILFMVWWSVTMAGQLRANLISLDDVSDQVFLAQVYQADQLKKTVMR